MTAAILLILSLGLGWLAIGLRAGGPRSATLWRQSTDIHSNKDKVFFFAIPGAALTMGSLAVAGLVSGTSLTFISGLVVPFALGGLWMLFVWGIMAFSYPLRMVPEWYRPIERERRERLRELKRAQVRRRRERRAVRRSS